MNTVYKNNIQCKRAIGLFYSREEAEKVVHALKDAGFDMDKVDLVARDADKIVGTQITEEIGNKADEGAITGALTGGALGGITGMLTGLGALAIPGVGPILFAGAEATAIATTLGGGTIGAGSGGLVGGLVGLGIPEEKAKVYSDGVVTGSFLVMVSGLQKDVRRAEAIMIGSRIKFMNKLTSLLLGSILILGVAACNTARTSSDAPSSIDGQVENTRKVEETLGDAANEIRQNQLNADIRAREQRNDLLGDQTDRADSDLESEVRSKLEANIPRAKLTVNSEDGVVTIVGTVPDQKEYKTVEPLAKEILGVKSVKTDVKVVPPANSQ